MSKAKFLPSPFLVNRAAPISVSSAFRPHGHASTYFFQVSGMTRQGIKPRPTAYKAKIPPLGHGRNNRIKYTRKSLILAYIILEHKEVYNFATILAILFLSVKLTTAVLSDVDQKPCTISICNSEAFDTWESVASKWIVGLSPVQIVRSEAATKITHWTNYNIDELFV